MPDAYEVHDGQFLQQITATSAADALSTYIGAVPPGKVWTLLAAYVTCSVAETQTYWFGIYKTSMFPITQPTSRTITPTVFQYVPCLLEGMEVKLFPGEYLYALRAAATAGSTITINSRLIETDLQYYVELDKQKVLRRREAAMESSNPRFLRRAGFGARSAFDRTGRDRESGREG